MLTQKCDREGCTQQAPANKRNFADAPDGWYGIEVAAVGAGKSTHCVACPGCWELVLGVLKDTVRDFVREHGEARVNIYLGKERSTPKELLG